MNDVFFMLGGVLTIGFIAIVVAIIESYGKCTHLWGEWSYKEDSACFIQKRQCVKCQYTEFQQIRKVSNDEPRH